MVKNYLIIALRFMSKQRGFSFINIAGLTIGIACSLLLLLYIQDELRFDRFHVDGARIYRVGFEGNIQGKKSKSTLTGFPVAEALQQIQEIETTTRLAKWATFPVRFNEKTFTEKYLLLADPNFFKFFSYKLIAGNADSVLSGSRKIVITESAAKRYFDYKGKGDTTPIGKTLILAQGYTAKITGIAEDPPLNSHFHFSLILSLRSWEETEDRNWISGKVVTYYKIKPEAGQKITAQKVRTVLQRNLNQQLESLRKTNLEEYKKQGSELIYLIQPLFNIHLTSNLDNELEANGTITYIYLFCAIAAFITLLACINFMNLTTAQSASRAKEVAVRKAVGANHDRLVGQFLLESYFYVVIGVIHALLVVLIALGPFNFFTGKDIQITTLLQPEFLIGILLFILITGLVAGSYPAFYLTHFSPIEVLKGNLRARLRSYGIRNVLVVFQFFISAALIIATLVVYQQLQYVQKADVGFEKSNIVNLLHTRNIGEHSEAFKQALMKHPEVISASYCNRLPPYIDWQALFRPSQSDKDYLLAVYEMDYDHLATMGYRMVDGRFFDKAIPGDSMSVILNETAARKLGLTDFQNKKIYTTYDLPSGRNREIIGIIQDFNYQSLKNAIQPMAIVLGYEPNWEMAIRVKAGDINKTVQDIGRIFKQYAPFAPFEYSLVENNFTLEHRTEKRIGLLFVLFTVLAIIIACLGLFGLATFTAEQHRKEIGIRKILGASVPHIVRMLNRDFLKLVLIANLVAWPFAWWIMNLWLDQFAYHTYISWWIFAMAGVLTSLIAFISISFRAYRAASGNPVNSLRNE